MTSSVDTIQKPGENISAQVNEVMAIKLIKQYYGFDVETIKKLDGYDDKNFFFNIKNPRCHTDCSREFVFKVMNSNDSKNTDVIEGQLAIIKHLGGSLPSIEIQTVVPMLNGRLHKLCNIPNKDGSNSKHVIRVLTYLPGKIMKDVPFTIPLLLDTGYKLACVHQALLSFHHPAYDSYKSIWHMQSVSKVLDFLSVVPDDFVINGVNARKLVENAIEKFEKNVPKNYDNLTSSQIHGDFNEGNLIVTEENDEYLISGVLDFGDSSCGYLCFDVGLTIAYMMLMVPDTIPLLDVGDHIIKGYLTRGKLNHYDLDAIPSVVGARLAASLVLGLYANKMNPSNDYVLLTQKKGWDVLSKFMDYEMEMVSKRWKSIVEKK